MISIVVYEVLSGQILRSVTCQDETVNFQYSPPTEGYVEHGIVDDDLFYVSGATVVDRPVFNEVIEGTVITGLPNPTDVASEGNTYTVTDGEADLTFAFSGTYDVVLSGFPYQTKTVKVTQK